MSFWKLNKSPPAATVVDNRICCLTQMTDACIFRTKGPAWTPFSVLLVCSSVDHIAGYSHTKQIILKALSLWQYKDRNLYHLSHSEGSILGAVQVLWFAHALILLNMPTTLKLLNYSPVWNFKMQQSQPKLFCWSGEHTHSHSAAFLPSPAYILYVLRLHTTPLQKTAVLFVSVSYIPWSSSFPVKMTSHIFPF